MTSSAGDKPASGTPRKKGGSLFVLPFEAILLPERAAPQVSGKPLQVETWVPVKGTERTLWLACDGDVSSPPATAMKGLYKANMGPTKSLREALSDLSHFQAPSIRRSSL